MSETHYSLKEMETEQTKPSGTVAAESRKPTTLWKRWKHISFTIRNSSPPTSRKPTTLWKRWKPETGYPKKFFTVVWVGNPLLSERDGNSSIFVMPVNSTLSCRKPTTLWKRWKHVFAIKVVQRHRYGRKPTTLWKRWKLHTSWTTFSWLYSCRKPTTLWKRWKLCFRLLLFSLLPAGRKPTTLWKRWKLLSAWIRG